SSSTLRLHDALPFYYTKNKLTRAILGARADPNLIEIEPDLAESWESNDDTTQFTFHIREGAKFHNVEPVNGRVLTAEDVMASFRSEEHTSDLQSREN